MTLFTLMRARRNFDYLPVMEIKSNEIKDLLLYTEHHLIHFHNCKFLIYLTVIWEKDSNCCLHVVIDPDACKPRKMATAGKCIVRQMSRDSHIRLRIHSFNNVLVKIGYVRNVNVLLDNYSCKK